MTGEEYPKDLIVLAADKEMEFCLRGILERSESLGIDKIEFEIYSHPKRDPGCLRTCHDFLRPFAGRFRHALVMLDREGCGKEQLTGAQLEEEIGGRLTSSGWGNRAAAVVIDPELESWIWSDSPEVDAALGWKDRSIPLRTWLKNKGFFEGNSIKPNRPKEAVEAARREVRKPRSASIYKQIADNVSLKRCEDPAFIKLKKILTGWFTV